MMDIIELAARALFWSRGGSNWTESSGIEKEGWIISARSMLDELREPSDAMVNAAMDAGFGPDVATRAYQAMIDAALSEGA